ncbi:MAG: NYN domain-containing protein [Austwickia sp.]|nr:NYN domain-containing protein [Austwickia sp.]MBK8436244.1 NYN domain-containing protein [Austwickia sp.]MBK9101922.1 NYN domain-containing protein [Austwickia sp.]
MDRCAVLVDAGYLLGAAATLIVPDGIRNSVIADYRPMLADIITQAAEQTGLPVLRVYWYDAWYDGKPAAEHLVLGNLPDVKVRLGVLVRHGHRIEQKGVDSFIQRDLSTLARHGAVADVILIAGDEDLRRGVDEVQDHGVKVHLWGVEAGAPQFNQARTLITEADRRYVLSEEWVRRFVRVRPRYAIPEPTPASVVEVAPPVASVIPAGEHAGLPQGSAGTAEHSQPSAQPVSTAAGSDGVPTPAQAPTPAAHASAPTNGATGAPRGDGANGHPLADTAEPGPPRPSPAALAHLRRATAPAGPPLPGTGTQAGHPGEGTPEHIGVEILTLAELSTQRQKWKDNEEDSTSQLAQPYDVGRRFGARWASRASAHMLEAARANRPVLPAGLDRELLKFAVARGVDTWDDDENRHAVRAGAWRALDDVSRLQQPARS